MSLFRAERRVPAEHRGPAKTCAVLLFFLMLLGLPDGRGRRRPGAGRQPQALFYQANNLYEEGRYEEAAAATGFLDHGYKGGNLFQPG